MKRCPNCNRDTKRTEDWSCQWCGYPILSTSYKNILKTFRQFQNEILAPPVPEPRIEPEAKPLIVAGLILLYLSYLAGIGAIEFITHYINISSGIILDFTILLMLIINSAVVKTEGYRDLFLALGLVPLIRIISLVIPVAEISEIYWHVIIALPVLVGIIAIARNLNYTFYDIGLNGRKPFIQVLVAIAGIGLGIIDYFILRPEGMIGELTIQTIILPAFILILSNGFVEELAFRGVMQRAARVLGTWGLVYVALVYTVLQIGHGSVSHCAFTFLAALFFGWIVKKTGSIIGISLSHGLLNVTLYLILPHVLLSGKYFGSP